MINNKADLDAIEFRENLDYDLLSHKILGILIRQRINVEIYHKERNVVLGVEYEELKKELDITKEEMFIVTSKLREELEIEPYRVDFEGYFAKPKAVYSYVSRKYLKKTRNEKRENIKYYLQIVIPVVSLLIAFLAITLNILQWQSNKKKSEQEIILNTELEKLNIRLDYLEEKTKNVDSVLLKIEQNP
ncbi:hypothetical protein OS188_14440 [Xanthomarina sp. F1114]|uniref:hypothetical protein n=1 Tax=Xanthomarina sp. F1114 TaxID=2996019 RepID=UPI00225E509E|nr:hypothetical protein [Xanthomarina sp. F1114]MCX7549153.1 hypothetical protein [Xanthomarina sp. F1114]